MPARILIVETNAGNRILTRAALEAGHNETIYVPSLAEARARMRPLRPDLVIIDVDAAPLAALGLMAEMKQSPETRAVPIIAAGLFHRPADRVRALRAGANELCRRPFHAVLLQARIRRLLRRRDLDADLVLKEETHRALGLAEDPEGYSGPQRIEVLTAAPMAQAHAAIRHLDTHFDGAVSVSDPAVLFGFPHAVEPADLYLIDAAGDAMRPGELFRLLAELRSGAVTRQAVQIAILPPNAPDMAAMALDLGADDLVTADVGGEELAHRVEALLKLKARTDRTRDALRSGIEASVTDPLTGLYNRRYALPHLLAMSEQASRTGRQLAVMILDIDHFKQINDSHGHAAGDRILTQVASRLRRDLREGDLLARIGGEEFLVAMPDTTGEAAAAAAERMRVSIEDTPFDARDGRRPAGLPMPPLRVTLSIGVAMGPVQDTGERTLFDRADAALYAAKTSGRNMVTIDKTAA